MSGVRIVLCMIVKNEEAVIQRCLKAALPHVDAYVITDTGSEDSTCELIEAMARARGIPGKIAHHPFEDFGHNRTLSAAEARAWVSEQGWSLEQTYLLLLDADMILHVEGAFDKSRWAAPSYDVRQVDRTITYYNRRLLSLGATWRAVGPTHEYWESDSGGAASRIDEAWIEDIGDGGSKGDKYERDIALLTRALEDEPSNPRYLFYLAQSLRDSGRFMEAAEKYRERHGRGGWDEERWYARFQEGRCRLFGGDAERGAGILLDAFEERPTRAEPLHTLARYYRELGRHRLAFLFAERALSVPFPAEDVLFVEHGVYEWQIWEEIMISAYYAGERELGARACEHLLERRDAEPAFYDYVAHNQAFYVSSLESARRGALSVAPALREDATGAYFCTNPTVVRWRGATSMNVRLVNYRQERGRVYVASDPAKIVRSRNVVLAWDPATGRTSQEREVRASLPPAWSRDTPILGLEDLRFTVHDDRPWFTATSCQAPNAQGKPRVVLGRMNEALDAVEHLVPLEFEEAGPVEKNWVPWSVDGTLYVIYSYDPFLVLRVEPLSGKSSIAACRRPAFNAGRFRGSVAPIPIPGAPGRWLGLVHEVTRHATENVYTHRFIELGQEIALTRKSRPFSFDHLGVEYATGLAAVDDDHLVVTYGFEDREARWIELEWRDVFAALALDCAR